MLCSNVCGVEHIYRNMRRVCKRIAPNLKLPKKDPIGEDTIVMHLRSGDNYHRVFTPQQIIFQTHLSFILILLTHLISVFLSQNQIEIILLFMNL